MKVLIVNQHSHNFGDDAAGVSLVSNLIRQNNVEKIDIIYNAYKSIPITDDKVNHDLDITLRDMGKIQLCVYFMTRWLFGGIVWNSTLKRMIELVRNADIVFVAPCGANIGIYKDWAFLIRLLIVCREKKSIVFHLNTLGASGNVIFDFLAKRVMKNSTIYVREERSLKYVESIGMTAKFGPDTAFSFPTTFDYDKESMRVSFVPTQLETWHPAFKNTNVDKFVLQEIVKAIAVFCKNNNLNIHILPHLCTRDEQLYNRKIVEALVDYGMDRRSVFNREDIEDVYGYNQAIAESRLVIGMRYHAIVMAAKNAVPFLSLGYENKMKQVCDYCEMSNYNVALNEMKSVQVDEIEKMLNEIYCDCENISKSIHNIVENKLSPMSKIPVIEMIMGKE